jgi:hypothetical protein
MSAIRKSLIGSPAGVLALMVAFLTDCWQDRSRAIQG